jgi:hypothetical protein
MFEAMVNVFFITMFLIGCGTTVLVLLLLALYFFTFRGVEDARR